MQNFHHLIPTKYVQLCQGGLSDGYKKYIAEKEVPDDTHSQEGLALFRVQGTGPENMQAIQVEAVSTVFIFLF